LNQVRLLRNRICHCQKILLKTSHFQLFLFQILKECRRFDASIPNRIDISEIPMPNCVRFQMNAPQDITRRPLKSRDTKWANAIAAALAHAGVRPNAISVAGTVFAAGAGISLWFAGRVNHDWRWSVLLLLAAGGMQLRLLCNLFDGMVAIEGGFKTKAGELFNELPDRFSDALIFAGAAYATPDFAWAHELGWAAAVLAVITAYVRALGASMGAGQHFLGPMAKQQRMGLMAVACVVAAATPCFSPLVEILPVALGLIAAGCLITIFRRCARIARAMESKP
jgi:phosphatidylglycerophosphate synthase